MRSFASKIAEKNGKRLIKRIQLEKREDVERTFSFNDISPISNKQKFTPATSESQHQLIDSSEFESAKNKWIAKFESNDKNPGLAFNFIDDKPKDTIFKLTLEQLSMNNENTEKVINDNCSSSSLISNITNEVNANDYKRRLDYYANSIRFNKILEVDNDKDNNSCHGICFNKSGKGLEKKDSQFIEIDSSYNMNNNNKKNKRINKSPLSIVKQTSCSYEIIHASTEENKQTNNKREGKYKNTSDNKASPEHSRGKSEDVTDSIDDISVKSFNTDSIVDLEESFGELNCI